MKKVSLLVVLIASLAIGQTVSISGTVTTSGGSALSGVIVRLVSSLIADTTDANGAYTLSGTVPTLLPVAQRAAANSILYKNNMFSFTTPAAAMVSVRLFDLRGAMVATVYSGRLNQGRTDVPFAFKNHGNAVYVMKVKSENATETYKIIPTGRSYSVVYDKSTSSGRSFLAKAAAFDWLQATKLGYSSHLEQLNAMSGVVDITMNATTTAPDFGSSVMVFDPSMSMSTIQSTLTNISNTQDGAQFGHNRYAWLFKPGSYSLDIDVGFYTEALGLGLSPDSVQITGAVRSSAAWMGHNATCTFWKSAAGFAVTPTGGNDVWEASQAAPVRRMHIKGGLALSDGGWSSGGFIADCKVDGAVNPGSQQQYFSRNSNVGSWGGGGWNYTFVGCVGAPADNGVSRTAVPKTPVIAEKPFLAIDKSNNYFVLVPNLRRDSTAGVSWAGGTTPGVQLPIDLFFIAKPTDNAAAINAALAQGKNLLLTPGHYTFESTVTVTRPGTIVLGIGFPTIVPSSGNVALKIADVDGVRVGGILLEGGSTNTPCLLQLGDSGSTVDHSRNPTIIYDIFTRVGGEYNGLATTFVKINSNDVVFDHCWLWRADHGTGAGWTSNKNLYGLIVNGNNVTCYGMLVEHTQAFQTWFNGENGRLYFYQSEMPYDPPDNTSWSEGGTTVGFPSYKVSNTVKTHEARGLGVYSVFRNNVTATNAFEVPAVAKNAGITMHHLCTQKLGSGEITHVINGTGGVASSSVVDYP
jgi:hypothetical protein